MNGHQKKKGSWFKIQSNGKKEVPGFVKIQFDFSYEGLDTSMLADKGVLYDNLPFRINWGDILLFNMKHFVANLISIATGSSWVKILFSFFNF